MSLVVAEEGWYACHMHLQPCSVESGQSQTRTWERLCLRELFPFPVALAEGTRVCWGRPSSLVCLVQLRPCPPTCARRSVQAHYEDVGVIESLWLERLMMESESATELCFQVSVKGAWRGKLCFVDSTIQHDNKTRLLQTVKLK